MDNTLIHNINKLGGAIQHSADVGGPLTRALHAAILRKNMCNMINTGLGRLPAGQVAQRAFQHVFKIKTQ